MQAILVLRFADTVAHGGMGMSAVLGAYRAVLWGGVLIAYVATSEVPFITELVGKLYRTDNDRRDAGFALYYRAINIGAFAAPLVTGWLGGHRGWHWGFSAAAIGMTLGLVQYVAGRRHLARRKHAAPFAPAPGCRTLEGPPSRRTTRLIVTGLVATVTVAVLRAAFEVTLAPVVAALWVRMGRRRPHASNKIVSGVVLGGLSLLLMALPTSGHSSDDPLMSVWWIVGSYLLLGLGDVLLETSGISATTELAAMTAAPWLRRTTPPVH